MRLAEPRGGLDALVALARRHANVGQDHVGTLGLDRLQQRIEIVARRHDLEVRLRLEEAADTFANEVVVLRQHDPKSQRGHSITQAPPSRPWFAARDDS